MLFNVQFFHNLVQLGWGAQGGKLAEGANLVPRVFVPYCACWLDDRWSRGTKTLGTRVRGWRGGMQLLRMCMLPAFVLGTRDRSLPTFIPFSRLPV